MKNFKHEKKDISNRHQLTREEIQAITSQTALLRRLMAKSYPWLVHSQQPENAIDFPR